MCKRVFFSYITVGYMEIIYHENDGVWIANVDEEGLPVIHHIQNVPPEFYEKVGRNTSYLYHYEEILAENFAYLMIDFQDVLPNPELLIRLDNILGQ